MLFVPLVEQIVRCRDTLQAVGLRLLDRGQPHVLVIGVAGKVELQHGFDAWVVDLASIAAEFLDLRLSGTNDVRVERTTGDTAELERNMAQGDRNSARRDRTI
jgi:hypothetical protein